MYDTSFRFKLGLDSHFIHLIVSRLTIFHYQSRILALAHPLLLSNLCLTIKFLVHLQDLIWQVATFRSMLLLNTANCCV